MQGCDADALYQNHVMCGLGLIFLEETKMYMDGKIYIAEVKAHFFWGDLIVSKSGLLALFYLSHTTTLLT